jgi:hypothetical protein
VPGEIDALDHLGGGGLGGERSSDGSVSSHGDPVCGSI